MPIPSINSGTDSDFLIIGGGIIGLSVGFQLSRRFPGKKITLIDKEPELAYHQTGRNSGVIHSGIYYKPGSMKSWACREGKKALIQFCKKEKLPYEVCGKIIVAVENAEIPGLDILYKRGKQNGVRCELIDAKAIRTLEPHSAGIKAIHVPEAGIVDYVSVCRRLSEIMLSRKANRIFFNTKLISFITARTGKQVAITNQGEFSASLIINCAGLHSDRLSTLSGIPPEMQIIPFRGEYFKLKSNAEHYVKNLIYPVPDPTFPFLGVHFTRMIPGGIECGPNAVLAFAREGYQKTDFSWDDFSETLKFRGMRKLIAKHWKTGMAEMWRSLNKSAFTKALQRIIPDIRKEDLETAPSGIRAQALKNDGSLVDDFFIKKGQGFVHVLNAPSPAATASLEIGRIIVEGI